MLSLLVLALATVAISSAVPRSAPFEHLLQKRQTASGNLTVDLGYESYQGFFNETNGLNQWNGQVCTLRP